MSGWALLGVLGVAWVLSGVGLAALYHALKTWAAKDDDEREMRQ